MGLPRPVVILLMEWVCGYRGAWKLLDLLLGSWPAGETVCLAEPRAVLLGCSPPTVAATCLSCCAFLHTVISRADLYGSNQATSVVSPMTFKTQSGKKCRTHFLSEGFIDNMSFNSRPERMNGVCILVKSVPGRKNGIYKGLKAKGCQHGKNKMKK